MEQKETVAKEEVVKVDALDALLSTDTNREKKIPVKRFNADFTIRAMSDDEFAAIKEEVRGNGLEENEEALAPIIVASNCVYPNFADPKILEKYNVPHATAAVKKALYAGETLYIFKAIMDHSGFDNIKAIKN